MPSISDYLANALNNQIFRGAAAPTVSALYYALVTAEPNPESTGSTIVEPSGNNYSRVNLAPGTGNYNASVSGVTWNLASVTFPQPSGSWGTIVGVAIVDASSAGNLLAYAPISAPQAIAATSTPPSFGIGQLRFKMGGGGGGPT